ncbi:MAG: cation diffusion facilitator family transporter [Salinarimonas sp.]
MFGNGISMARRPAPAVFANRNAGTWKRVVAFGSFLTTLALTLGKLIAGLISGSVALMSDAVQGIADIAVTLVTLYTVSVSDRPACPRYTYGRQKLEAFASLIEAALLFIFGCVIVFMGMVRLLVHAEPVKVEPWLLSIVAATALADLWRHFVLQRCARATGSIALGANAMHFLADALSSAIVFISLILVWAGFESADLIATFLIAAILFRMSWRTYDHGSRALCDSVDPQVSWDVHEIISAGLAGAGEAPLRSLRLRLVPGTWFVEAIVVVAQDTPLAQVAKWQREIASRLEAHLGPVEFLLQPEPDEAAPATVDRAALARSPRDADRGS